jgi:hypothetical protein
MTSGEHRFAQKLEDKLEEDYLLWYNVSIGHQRLHSDLIMLHPLRGNFYSRGQRLENQHDRPD